jgi:hypothetical protein
VAAAAEAVAQAGGPELKTDDPYFPGEAAFSSPARVIQYANAVPRGTVGTGTDREKLIRLFLWRAEHFAHQESPAVYNLPSRTPNPGADDPLMTDYDSMRALFSYGWGLCGTNHAQMRVFADEAAWPSRRRGLQGDTGYEILVDGGWRYCNTDQYTLHFLSNVGTAHFASLDEVVNTNHHYAEWNPDPGLGFAMPQANTHGGYQDFAGVTGTVPCRSLQWRSYYGNGTNGVWDPIPGGNNKMYGEGYTATPVVLRLRRGETFTRWLSPQGIVTDLGLSGRIWWGYNAGNQGGGDNSPFVPWSFVQNAPAHDQTSAAAPEASSLVGQRYGNGCFLWQPNLAQGEHLDGTAEVTGTLSSGGSPALKSSGASQLVLFQNTPYTIAGRPADAKDPATTSSDGAVLTADAVGAVSVDVSTNAGATWTSIGALSGAGAKIDFTDSVKGRNQYLLRLSFADGQGLDSLSLRTVTMLSQAVYPNLKSGTANITYSASNTGALELSPDLWSATSANSATGYVQKLSDSGNITADFYATTLAAYVATDNNPVVLTYKIAMPPALAAAGAVWKQIFAGGDYGVRIPPDGGQYGRVEISPDQTTWTKIGEHLPPADNDLSSYWAYGRSGDAATLGGTTYYVRFSTSNGSHPASVRYLRLGATYTMPASAAPVEVTYAWNNGAAQTDVHTVAAGVASDSWAITTGTVASQAKVALKVVSAVATPTPPTITIQPADRTVTVGQTATFTVSATGTPTLTYQWSRNGTNIPGATNPSYTTAPTTLADNGAVYRVTVANGQGSVPSNPATLAVNAGGGGPTTATFQQGASGYAGTTDTYIDQFAPTSSFGTLDRLEIRYYDPGTGLTEHMQTLIRFDLSSIPTTATVTSAKLTMWNTRATANSPSDVVLMDKVLGAWTDAQTWSMGIPASTPSGVTTPSVAGFTLAPATPEPWVITGMGALVQGWITAPASNLGVKFSCTTNLNLRLASSEYGSPQYRPLLEVTYTTGGPPDTTPPTLTITSPSSGPASSSPLTVTGTASDAGGVSQVTWSNALTGGSGTAAGTTSWTASIPLAPGSNVITISATDLAGNTATSVITMTLGGGPAPSGGGGGGGGGHKTCGLGAAEPLGAGWIVLALGFVLLTVRRR